MSLVLSVVFPPAPTTGGWARAQQPFSRIVLCFGFAILPAQEEDLPVDRLSSLVMDPIGIVGIAGSFH